MKKLQTFYISERPQAGLLKNVLEERGIPCILRNERLFAAMGEIPFLECLPELWVVNDEDFYRARQILEEWQSPGVGDREPWLCSVCGETVEGELTECWNCGSRPGT